jgi:DNA-binding NarL/FixJ family response regulator
LIKVLLADDHAIVAEGLQALLKESFDLVGIARDGRALVDAAKRLQPNVIVTDISMPLLNGLDAVRLLRNDGIDAKVVFLTMHRDPNLAAEAFRAGASGFLLKDSAGDELVTAIQQVAQGRAYLTPLIAKDVLTLLMESKEPLTDKSSKLTLRQREVLQLIAEGKTTKEIAVLLNISVRTAESHKYDMMETLGAATTAELIRHAIRMKLVSVSL